MNSLKSVVLLFSLLSILNGCNSSSPTPPINNNTGDKSQISPAQALEIISAYAEDNTKTTPSLSDYQIAGITGVNADNLQAINEQIAKQKGSEVDTSTKVQLIVNNVNKQEEPVISGIPKTFTNIYDLYNFQPVVSNKENIQLTFSIANKPDWASFDKSTGRLSGSASELQTHTGIVISVSDGNTTVSLNSFSIEVKPATNLAHKFGKAIQGSTYQNNEKTYGADKAIDNDLSTINHTKCDNPDNDWWQLQLPNPTDVAKVVIHNRAGQTARLNGVKVYLRNTAYTGVVNENNLIKTLNSSMEQTISFDPKKQAQYLLIKSTTCLHTPEVEVYGITPTAPVFAKDAYQANIHRWYNKVESVLNIEALDYQYDALSYSIIDDAPFTIDNKGDIRVKDFLTQDKYTFGVKVSDGLDSVTTSVTININNIAKANQHIRVTDATPFLTGYLPNTYKDGDSVTITIDGKSYMPTINSDGTWSIADDVINPRLAIAKYDISIVINNDPAIVYTDFFEIYGASEFGQKISLSPSYLIESIDVTISSSSSAPLVRGKKVRGSSMWLKQENGKTIFVNESYRKMKSVIVSYKDNSNNTLFKKLVFDIAINPYSTNELVYFTDLEKMSIFYTAGQFDKEMSFAGADRICTESSTPGPGRTDCSPTNRNETPYSDSAVQNPVLSEQQIYTQVEATWHHIYNRVDGLKSINAWINREVYKGMDFTTDYQSSDDYAKDAGKTEFFTRNFFAAFLPNNTTQYFALRYHYPAEGLAGLPNQLTSFEGESTQGGWAGLWEGSLRLGKDGSTFRLSPFEYIHHEEMHSNGMGHQTGLTYGWPHHATKIFIKKYYTPVNTNDAESAIFPKVEAPKYIFTTEALSENSVKLTVYKTNDANAQDLTFEVFSGKGGRAKDFSFEALDENSVKLTFDKSIFPRFFVRLYGDDSDELMSKLITPTLVMSPSQKIITDTEKAKKYYFIPHQQWKKVAPFIDLTVHKDSAKRVCKILTQNFDADVGRDTDVQRVQSTFRNSVDAIGGSKKFYGLKTNWWQYSIHDFSNGNYQQLWLRDFQDVDNTITDETIDLMCVTPN